MAWRRRGTNLDSRHDTTMRFSSVVRGEKWPVLLLLSAAHVLRTCGTRAILVVDSKVRFVARFCKQWWLSAVESFATSGRSMKKGGPPVTDRKRPHGEIFRGGH
ncbi:hypothetical protein Mapa_010053 [Marchantia paleacea]|nr:hypothetical protein Mapa_010053 [Marchantia paleacea]